MRRRWAAPVLAVVVLVLVGVAQTAPGTSLLRSLGIDAASQPFTELYFARPADIARLTEGLGRDDRRVTPVFVIHNKAHHTITYQWSIIANGISRTSGTSRLNPGASTTIAKPVSTGCLTVRPSRSSAARGARRSSKARGTPTRPTKNHARGARRRPPRGPSKARVAITLAAPRQAIFFWIPCAR